MCGHGGLNILPQKSWNVYNLDNRLKVQRDEEQAAREAADEARRQALEEGERKLAEMRARAGRSMDEVDGALSVPASSSTLASARAKFVAGSGHINFFADIEAAQKNADHEAEAKRAEARAIARIMPDLQLDRSATEPAPWYARAPAAGAPPPPLPGAPLLAAAAAAAPVLLLGPGEERDGARTHGKTHKRDREDKHGRKHGRKRKHEHGEKRRRRSGEEEESRRDEKHKRKRKRKRRPSASSSSSSSSSSSRSPSAERGGPSSSASASLVRLRQERLVRERREQARPVGMPSPSHPCAGANGDASGAEVQRFMQLTGQTVSIKQRPQRPPWNRQR